MVVFHKFTKLQIKVCSLVMFLLACFQTSIAQNPKKFYLQAHVGVFHAMPTYIGTNPKNYLNTNAYDNSTFLGGSGGAIGYQINNIFGVEIAHQHHAYQAPTSFGYYMGGSYAISQGKSWALRGTAQKYINLHRIGLGDWYIQGFAGLLVINTSTSTNGIVKSQNQLFYNIVVDRGFVTSDTLEMNTSTSVLKQNFLNLELGLRIEKVFAKRLGIFLGFSHTLGLGTVYQENISFDYNSVPQGSMQRTYSGAGIYTSVGMRYHFDLGFLKKKPKTALNLQNSEDVAPPKPKKKPIFIFRIF